MEISPDNHWLVTASEDGTARLWDLTAKEPAASQIVLRGHQGAVLAVAVSMNNHWLVTGSGDGTARLWDLTAKDPAANRSYCWARTMGVWWGSARIATGRR